MTRWLETDNLSNQNISSALAIGSYTADADRSILCQFFADQVAGNGDYIFYLTLQVAGAGSAYVMVPKTTGAAASGETAIGGQSIIVNVRNGDVVTAYLDGLAGDTTTPDTSVRWFELAALRPTTADRTLDVSATGEAGVDWANVGSPTTTVGLIGTTVDLVADAITSAKIADDAIATEHIATGAITADSIAASAIDLIWDEVLEGTLTARQIQRLALAVLAGISTGGGSTTIAFRNVADDADRVSATVDSEGNRDAIVLDGS